MSREGWRIAKLAEEATMIPESDTGRGTAPESVADAGEVDSAREAPGPATTTPATTDDAVAAPIDAADAPSPEPDSATAAAPAQPEDEVDDEAQPEDEVDDEAQPEARPDELRLIEALLFAATAPLDEKTLAKRLPAGSDVHAALKRLQLEYAPRGVNLVRIGSTWAFRTANDLAWLLTHEASEPKKLSRAAIETLAIVAYHQPVTRAEIEDIRGVAVAKGTLDVLMETGWIRLRGRRKAPGRPVTYGTTDQFLSHFGLEQLGDLPGLDELKGAGLFDGQLPAGFGVPSPSDDPALREDEEPLDAVELDLGLAPRVEDAADEPAPQASADAPARPEGD
ncbi:Segregation and condensation protein B [Rhodoplanes serenus]|uniref:Segregation and condensation protein B n=2 Tax=Nitrobacteraceae TaxID=41294 RepID=A0A3S4DHR8_9BRAD|nr:Segregation and condensation protein B [Rhodoplanes serenus]